MSPNNQEQMSTMVAIHRQVSRLLAQAAAISQPCVHDMPAMLLVSALYNRLRGQFELIFLRETGPMDIFTKRGKEKRQGRDLHNAL